MVLSEMQTRNVGRRLFLLHAQAQEANPTFLASMQAFVLPGRAHEEVAAQCHATSDCKRCLAILT